MKTPEQIAQELFQLMKEDKYQEIYETLYSQDIISIEDPIESSEYVPYQKRVGMEEKMKASQEWMDSVQEVHSDYMKDPVVVGNVISIAMGMDVTLKNGQRMEMHEVAVYGVKEGKIIKEQFIY